MKNFKPEIKWILIFMLMIAIFAIHKWVIAGAYLVLCAWAFWGTKQAIQALALNYVILLLNPALFSLPGEVSVLRWVVLFCAFLRVLPSIFSNMSRFVLPLLLFYGAILAFGWISSPHYLISALKLTIFVFGAITMLAAFDALKEEDLAKVKTWLLSLGIAVFILSLPTLLVHSVGFFRNGRGFQGILNHPQAFAVYMAPLAAFFLVDFLFRQDRKSLWSYGWLGTLLIVIFLTQARTATLTILLSALSVTVITLVKKNSSKGDVSPSSAIFKYCIGGFILLVLALASPQFRGTIEGFVFKGSTQYEAVGDALYHSRGRGAEFYWNRFLDSPLIGNGFGIDVAHGNEKNPTTFLGIPVSASTEKGFLPIAFLEEVGLIGLIFFLPFLWALFRAALYNPDPRLVAMFFACLFVNIGEAVFFSPGQMGGYLWLLIGLAAARNWNGDPALSIQQCPIEMMPTQPQFNSRKML